MVESILRTKLFIPPVRPNLVSRPRLIARLDEGLQLGRKLSLISAPAGFGKTTVVSAWVAGSGRPAAWLSLDEGDGDLFRFLTYVTAALRTVSAGSGQRVLQLLNSAQPLPPQTILTPLVNDIAVIPEKFTLVLDDYHRVDSLAVDQALTFLLEHIPPSLHLVIATREDPHMPLAHVRARGEMSELRTRDLRFTTAEAAQFLNQAMGLDLPAEAVAALEERTEGWVAALQLAALSMRGRRDTAGFIEAFAGDHRYVLDYLVQEVLERQPKDVRSFLLETSILERLSAPLCSAVTGQEESVQMLHNLELENLFLIALDDKRRWYRYHHLFGDVLQTLLQEERAGKMPELHRRASAWYEENDLPGEAIGHALAAGEFERAADLAELAWPEAERSYRTAAWLAWVNALPDEVKRARPVLCVAHAWALLNSGAMEASESSLRAAERWLDGSQETAERPFALRAGMVVVDEEQFRALPASIAAARAYRALATGDIPATITFAQQALDRLPEGNYQWRAAATSLLGLAQYANGNLEAADEFLTALMADMERAGNVPDAIGIAFLLADIRTALGRLHKVERTYHRALRLAENQDGPLPLGISDLYRGLGELHRERNELDAARQQLSMAEGLGKEVLLTDWTYRLAIAKARLEESLGNLESALNLLQEAENAYVGSPLPEVRSLAALRARIWIAQGRLQEATWWAHEEGVSAADELSYLREFEHVTLARLLIAQHRSGGPDEALGEAKSLLSRLLEAAEDGKRMGSAIEILMLQALAEEAQDDIPGALASLERALALAEPEGYVRVFVDEGPPMMMLLREASQHNAAAAYAGQLLGAFEKDEGGKVPVEPLMDPLSEREVEVLRLLQTELSGPEIARELMVSLNTIRTHTKNIYSKLEVRSRRAAVRRAQELSLL